MGTLGFLLLLLCSINSILAQFEYGRDVNSVLEDIFKELGLGAPAAAAPNLAAAPALAAATYAAPATATAYAAAPAPAYAAAPAIAQAAPPSDDYDYGYYSFRPFAFGVRNEVTLSNGPVPEDTQTCPSGSEPAPEPETPESLHAFLNQPKKITKEKTKIAMGFETLKKTFPQYLTSPNQPLNMWTLPAIGKVCKVENLCNFNEGGKDLKYRSYDGSCNNMQVDKIKYGMENTAVRRLTTSVRVQPETAYYKDTDMPRNTSVLGMKLPSARKVSSGLTITIKGDGEDIYLDKIHTVLVMQMGQFIDHDFAHSPTFRIAEEIKKVCPEDSPSKILPGGISCCNLPQITCCNFTTDGMNNSGNRELLEYLKDVLDLSECFPIEIEESDTVWRGQKTCMEFTRSRPTPTLTCDLQSHRQQVNQLTHWLDSSNIYGSDEIETLRLRNGATKRGRLRTGTLSESGQDLLPLCESYAEGDKPEPCEDRRCRKRDSEGNDIAKCTAAGEFRVNEHLNLMVMHTIWFREHNRVADKLAGLNPSWDDEKVFQEAKRFVNAEYQHIIYNEWLPIVLGRKNMEELDLLPKEGYSSAYSAYLDPSISNEFATAAFRFGHSLIPHSFKRVSDTGETIQLDESFFNSRASYNDNLLVDELGWGMTNQQGQQFDKAFVDDIKDNLFKNFNDQGLDLIALNIQRGRDHGLPGYNVYREVCKNYGLKKAQTWTDFEDFIPASDVEKLKMIYRHVDDVDLFVGGYMETPSTDGIVGPTFKCIMTEQFARLKIADRFFYDLGEVGQGNIRKTLRFTPDQLREIKKTSMSRVMCDNLYTDEKDKKIQPLVFMNASPTNQRVSCSDGYSIPVPDLGVFQSGYTAPQLLWDRPFMRANYALRPSFIPFSPNQVFLY